MSEIALRLVKDAITNSSSCLKSYTSSQYSITNSQRVIRQFVERLNKIDNDLSNLHELSHIGSLLNDIRKQRTRLKKISQEHTFLYRSLLVHLKFLVEELSESEKDMYQAVNLETMFGGKLPWDI